MCKKKLLFALFVLSFSLDLKNTLTQFTLGISEIGALYHIYLHFIDFTEKKSAETWIGGGGVSVGF